MPAVTKEERELFFSNHQGSTSMDVLSSLILLPLSLLFLYSVTGLWSIYSGGSPPSYTSRFCLEYTILIVPLLISLVGDWSGGGFESSITVLLLVAQIGGMNFGVWVEGVPILLRWDGSPLERINHQRPVFVSNFRGAIMLLTVIVILAVDFPAFPRHMAKTESMGVSLMDFVVGAMMFSSGLSWRVVKIWGDNCHCSSDTDGVSKLAPPSPPSNQKLVLLKVLALGSLRLLIHTLSNQHAHVSEYGVHWNFYFSLAAVMLLSQLTSATLTLLASLLHPAWLPTLPPNLQLYARAGSCLLGGLVISFAFEALVLTRDIPQAWGYGGRSQMLVAQSGDLFCSQHPQLPGGLGLYSPTSLGWLALCSERSGALVLDLFWQNREGVLSLAGFFSLFFMGAGVGLLVRGSGREAALSSAARGVVSGRPWKRLLVVLTSLSLLLWTLYIFYCSEDWEWAMSLAAQKVWAREALWWPNQPAIEKAKISAASLPSLPPGYPVSRRLANAPYTLWVAATSTTLLTAFLGVEALDGLGSNLGKCVERSILFSAFSAHSLYVFVVANLSVGVFNAVAKSVWGGAMRAPTWAALVLLLAHTLCVFALGTRTHKSLLF